MEPIATIAPIMGSAGPAVPIGGSPVMGGAGAPIAPAEALVVVQPVEDDFDENSYRVRAPGLDMQPGDFRFITMRESCRSIYKSVYLAIASEEWTILAGLDVPYEYTPDAELTDSAREEQRRFGELSGHILSRVPLGGYGEWGLAHSALYAMHLIAKYGWRGYMEREIAARSR
jgi:hypothetical protein